ncbi:MAG: GntR family transcriptional regulator [Gemmatimonadota bacterium]
MLISIDQTDERPIYIQIMDEVRRGVVMGLILADEALPSVRQLALDLRVNPNTVMQAYRELEREGVVEVRRGQGTYVAQSRTTSKQRRDLVREVAERATRDAHRNGVHVHELIDELRGSPARDQRKRA